MVVLHGMSCEDLNFASPMMTSRQAWEVPKKKAKKLKLNYQPGTRKKKKQPLLNGWMEMVISQPFPVCKGLESSSI